eukprot:CAMPEP_0185041850 /NCGR_PEP_ID=MMETSP1103-20130426/41682_1 /TAXON_ID=36769 /ORGANISM="Paraphysomonas bandaiensis, Strain Caron Lab Isolate" /LENGTH=56 /DNA_ID=CAMNT_0027581777 /DNA_START=802 /DNA_END=972 /DNA_ORIENTATION=+
MTLNIHSDNSKSIPAKLYRKFSQKILRVVSKSVAYADNTSYYSMRNKLLTKEQHAA